MDMPDHTTKPGIEVSIVIPVRDEEANIGPLAREIQNAMDASPWSWEAIWVNDCSTDNTPRILKELHERDARHKFLSFNKNRGQSAALAAGFNAASSPVLATLDGDGQNDPADIPKLIRHLHKNNLDMVNGYRENRKDSFARRIVSRLGNIYRNWITDEHIKDVGCSIRVFTRECTQGMPLGRGMHRFITTYSRINGRQRMAEIPVNHRPRRKGVTKYGYLERFREFFFVGRFMKWMLTSLEIPPPSQKPLDLKRRQSDQD